ncbi:hypothetical protein V8E52_011958 [Russula decolorans]
MMMRGLPRHISVAQGVTSPCTDDQPLGGSKLLAPNHPMGYEPSRSPSVVDNLALGIRDIAVEDDASRPCAAFPPPEYGQYSIIQVPPPIRPCTPRHRSPQVLCQQACIPRTACFMTFRVLQYLPALSSIILRNQHYKRYTNSSAWIRLWDHEVATFSPPAYQFSPSVCSACRVWYPSSRSLSRDPRCYYGRLGPHTMHF